uniref:Uncharacterized protein n=1 Tax=Solanum tuberosum TaxID=4113 RepID=M1CHW4_SOLTU
MFTPGTHVTAASFSSFIQPSVYRKQSIYLLKVGVRYVTLHTLYPPQTPPVRLH